MSKKQKFRISRFTWKPDDIVIEPSEKEKKVTQLKKAILAVEELQKGWVTVNGQHMFFPDAGEGGGGRGGGGKGQGGARSPQVVHSQAGGAGNINGMDKQAVHDAILKQAQANPYVKDPEALAAKLTAEYGKAAVMKDALDKAATKVASQIPDARVITTPLKGFKNDGSFNPSRSIDKMNQEGTIRDLARNTIMVKSVADAHKAEELLTGHGVVVSPGKNYFNAPTELGYRGINANHSSGTGEIQINVPQVVYFKEPPAVSRAILGNNTFHAVAAQAKQAGLPAGQGHALYEQYRNIENKAIVEGRVSSENGIKQYRWTAAEKSTVTHVVDQSNRGYELAIGLAK